VSYIPQAKILGKTASVIHSSYEDRWQLTPALFRQFLKQRKQSDKPALMILNYPGNPDGVTLSAENLVEIAALAREHKILILSDEIYGQLHHQGRHVSIGKYYPEGTILSSGLSKWCGAGGWRLGTFTFPKNLHFISDKMGVVASETYTSVSAPIQFAAIRAFRGGTEIEEYLWHTRKILANLGKECVSIFRESHVRVHDPIGGFYFFLDFFFYAEKLKAAGINTSKEFCLKLLDDTGVALLDGNSFARPESEFTARMAYVDFDGARALAAAKIVPLSAPLPDDFNKTYCQRVIDGTIRITNWLNQL